MDDPTDPPPLDDLPPLYHAVLRLDGAEVARFIAAGEDVGDDPERTFRLLHALIVNVPQMNASQAEEALRIVGLLLDAGADIEQRDLFGWTPLHRVANHGLLQVARLLVARGADLNARVVGDEGYTPLMEAASCGRTEVVRLLLESGAEPGIRNEIGLTAAQLARQKKHKEVLRILISLE